MNNLQNHAKIAVLGGRINEESKKDELPKGKIRVRYTVPAGYKFDKTSPTARRKAPKVLPNDDCPCGSGKKAKRCCLKH